MGQCSLVELHLDGGVAYNLAHNGNAAAARGDPSRHLRRGFVLQHHRQHTRDDADEAAHDRQRALRVALLSHLRDQRMQPLLTAPCLVLDHHVKGIRRVDKIGQPAAIGGQKVLILARF